VLLAQAGSGAGMKDRFQIPALASQHRKLSFVNFNK
jgi:hypothetical protein